MDMAEEPILCVVYTVFYAAAKRDVDFHWLHNLSTSIMKERQQFKNMADREAVVKDWTSRTVQCSRLARDRQHVEKVIFDPQQ